MLIITRASKGSPLSFEEMDANLAALMQHAVVFNGVGDGLADDTDAFVDAATALRTEGGGRLILSPGKTYKVLPTGGSAGAKLLDLQNCRGLVVEGNGAKILTGNVTAIQTLFDLNGTTDVLIRDLELESGYAALDPAAGIDWIKAYQGAKRILLVNTKVTYGRIWFSAIGAVNGGGSDSDRCRDIVALNCDLTSCYYPLSFQGAGDNFFGRGINAVNCGRVYFPYNVRNHDVVLESTPGGPFSDVLLKVYSDTRWYSRLENINVVYHCNGRYAGSGNQSADEAHVSMELQVYDAATAAAGAFENVHVTAHLTGKPAPDQSQSVFILRKMAPDGSPDATTRGHLISDVSVRGSGSGMTNLLSDWFKVCTRAGETWTNEIITSLELGWNALDGTAGQVALAVNGDGLLGLNAAPSLVVDRFYGNNADISLSNVAGKGLSITRSRFANYNAQSRNTETYTVSWTGSTANPAIGNGTLKGSYVLHDGLCTATVELTIGSTTTFGTGDWRFSLPLTSAPTADMAPALGSALVFDSGTAWLVGVPVVQPAAGYATVVSHNTAVFVNGTVPIAWAAGDKLYLSVTYPIGKF